MGLSNVEPKVKKRRSRVDDLVAFVLVKSDGLELGLNLERSLLTGFTLNFNDSGNTIPRKPRGSVGSKSHVAKHLGPSGSVDETNQMKSDYKGWWS